MAARSAPRPRSHELNSGWMLVARSEEGRALAAAWLRAKRPFPRALGDQPFLQVGSPRPSAAIVRASRVALLAALPPHNRPARCFRSEGVREPYNAVAEAREDAPHAQGRATLGEWGGGGGRSLGPMRGMAMRPVTSHVFSAERPIITICAT